MEARANNSIFEQSDEPKRSLFRIEKLAESL